MRKFYFLAACAAMVVTANAQQIPAGSYTCNVTPSDKVISVAGNHSVSNPFKAERVEVSKKQLDLPTVSRPHKAPAVAADQTWVPSDTKITLTDDAVGPLYGLDCFSLENIAIEESQETPGFYRLINPYASYPKGSYDSPETRYLYLHTEYGDNYVYFEEFATGVTLNRADGEMLIGCDGGDYMSYYNGQYTPQQLAAAGVEFGSIAGGNITFPVKSMYVGFVGSEGLYYANNSGKFCIAFPGASDYSFDIVCSELYNDTNIISFSVEAGADIDKVLYLSVPGKYPAIDGNLDLAKEYGQEIAASTSYNDNYSEREPGFVTLFAVGLDAEGNRVAGDVAYFVVINHDYYTWKSLGLGSYTDDLLSTYSMNPITYEVEVEECVEKPGYYRLKNPFGPGTPYWNKNKYESGDPAHYLYIDATDPEKVNVDFSVVGLILDEDGDIFVISNGAYNPGTTNAAAYGKMEDGVISFSTAKNIYMGFGNDLDGLYNSNSHGAFSVTIPEATIVVLWNNESLKFAAPHVHYSLDGGLNFEVPVAMMHLDEAAFSAEGEDAPTPGTEIWGAEIPADATHVCFSDGGNADDTTNVFEAQDGVLYHDSVTTGIELINANASQVAEYFNLQGIRVANPAAGGIYIVRNGNVITKVIK